MGRVATGQLPAGLVPSAIFFLADHWWGSCRFWVLGRERERGVTGDKIFFFLCLCALGEEKEDA